LEGNAFLLKQTGVKKSYVMHAKVIDIEMGDNRCVELRREHGSIRAFVMDTRVAISDNFTHSS